MQQDHLSFRNPRDPPQNELAIGCHKIIPLQYSFTPLIYQHVTKIFYYKRVIKFCIVTEKLMK